MRYTGEYFDLDDAANGKFNSVRVRVNPDDIMDELGRCIKHLKNRIEDLESELGKVTAEKYKDDELKRMKTELDSIKEERYYGFEITKEEHDKIESWKDDWFKRKKSGYKYMGAIGGGFTYKFIPTSIGVVGVVIAPDGEEFNFQELG